LRVPIFGREEDAADQFAAYTLLQFGHEETPRIIAA
jgi:Putative metallopeptidase